MGKVALLYFFIWWFIKLKTKKPLIVRLVLASTLALFFFISVIVVCAMEDIVENGMLVTIIFCSVLAVLFSIRAIFDIIKLKKIIAENNSFNANKTSHPLSQAPQSETKKKRFFW